MTENTNAPLEAGARCEGNLNHSHATTSALPTTTGGPCPRCHRLDCVTAAELYAHIVGAATGDELSFWEGHFALTADMLFVRGWSGTKTDIEKRFLAGHAATLSPARQRQRERRAEMMLTFAARRRNPTTGDGLQAPETCAAAYAAIPSDRGGA